MKRVFLLIFVLSFFYPLAFVCAQEQPMREMVVLAINDVYRVEGVGGGEQGGLAMVRALRQELERDHPNVLLLHAGDFLFPSLLSEWSKGAHMIEMMNRLDGAAGRFDPRMFVTFGNHEFDQSDKMGAGLLGARIKQSGFQWLGANIRFSQMEGKPILAASNFLPSTIVQSGGIRVGIFGLTTDRKAAQEIEYVHEFLDPLIVAEQQSTALRAQGAEVVIALTHLSIDRDRHILETLGERGPDLIIGGHEHQRHHVEVNGRWILKADADARTATVTYIRMLGEKPLVSFGYRFLDQEHIVPDPMVQRQIEQTLIEHEDWFCAKTDEEAGCLQQSIGETAVPLIGDELEIRRYETNLGNWVADAMRAIMPDADLALINAGALRINYTIPAGPITRRQFEELLFYDSQLVQLEISNEDLDAILERAAEDWVGQGHWLQVSGVAFEHEPRNPKGHRIHHIQLFHNGQLTNLPIRPLRLITNTFLLNGGDGYDMFHRRTAIPIMASLKAHLLHRLAANEAPIHPQVDGRICNLLELRKRPCAFPIFGSP